MESISTAWKASYNPKYSRKEDKYLFLWCCSWYWSIFWFTYDFIMWYGRLDLLFSLYYWLVEEGKMLHCLEYLLVWVTVDDPVVVLLNQMKFWIQILDVDFLWWHLVGSWNFLIFWCCGKPFRYCRFKHAWYLMYITI